MDITPRTEQTSSTSASPKTAERNLVVPGRAGTVLSGAQASPKDGRSLSVAAINSDMSRSSSMSLSEHQPKSEDDRSKEKKQQSTKDEKWGDLEKETWKSADALRQYLHGLWTQNLLQLAKQMRAANCGLPKMPELEGIVSGREITIWLTKEGIDSVKAHDVGQSLVDAGFIYHIYFYNRFKDADDAYYKLRDPDVVTIFRELQKWIKTREKKVNKKKYQNCFTGYEAVSSLMIHHYHAVPEKGAECHELLRAIMKEGLMHHPSLVMDFDPTQTYKIRELLDFEIDDHLIATTRRVVVEIADSGLVKDRKSLLSTLKSCFIGDEFLDWLIGHARIANRQAATELAQRMLRAHFIEGMKAQTDRTFVPGHDVYYRFNTVNITSHSPLTCEMISSLRQQRNRQHAAAAQAEANFPQYMEIPPPSHARTKTK